MNNRFLETIPDSLQLRFVLFLVFLLPIVAVTLNHGSSVLYGLLLISSLFYVKGGWRLLDWSEKRILLGFSLFFLLSALSMLYTDDIKVGAEVLERYLRLIFLLPIYLALRSQGLDTSRVFISGALIGVLVMSVQGWYQVSVLYANEANGAYHKITFGDMAILLSALIFMATLHFARTAWMFALGGVGIALGVYASLLSHTRASWLFVPIFGVVIFWLYRNRWRRKDWLLLVVSIGIVAAVVLVTKPEKTVVGLQDGVSDIKGYLQDPNNVSESSWDARLNMWNHSLLIFKSNPIFGGGIGGYYAGTQKLLDSGQIPAAKKDAFSTQQKNAHSIYFQLLAEGGLVGLFILITTLLLFPFLYLYKLWQSTSDNQLQFVCASGLVSLLAYAWFGLSTNWLITSPQITVYCVIVLVFLTSAANRMSILSKTENKF